MKVRQLPIIGSTALVTVAGIENVPAKVDTGADSSSIWASNIVINSENQLEFCFFGPESHLYTGEKITVDDYSVQRVRSSTGEVTIRYRVPLSVQINGRSMKAKFTLYDRSKNNFPILIGRKTLKNRFLVDVAQRKVKSPPKMDNSDIKAELAENPQKFHTKLYNLYQNKDR